MYNDFYAFENDPFNVTPDPNFIFYSDQHKEVLAHMLYGVKERRGFIVVTGRVGSGKTTLCRAFLREIGDETSTALILNSKMSAPELMESIAEDFGYELPEQARSKEVIDSLNDFLLSEYRDGRNACVIIDESQNLSPEALEQLRLLSNLETEKEKLLQIILVGQPELDDLLDRPELRQLQQRVALRAYLTNLDEQETREYVRHRIEKASRAAPAVHLEEEVLSRLYEVTEGNPRAINLLADRALMAAYLDESQVVTPTHLEQGLEDLSGGRPPSDGEGPETGQPVQPVEPGGEKEEARDPLISPETREVFLRGTSLLVGAASALATLVLGIAAVTWLSWWNQPRVMAPPPNDIAPIDSPAAETAGRLPTVPAPEPDESPSTAAPSGETATNTDTVSVIHPPEGRSVGSGTSTPVDNDHGSPTAIGSVNLSLDHREGSR